MEVESFTKGYKKLVDRLEDMLVDEDWNYFGIIDYDYTEIEDKIVITPESFMVALADYYNKKWGKNVLVILNYKRKGKFALFNSQQLDAIKSIVERNKDRMKLLEFSYNDLGIGEKVKIKMIEPKKSFIQRKFSSNLNSSLIDAGKFIEHLEERSYWSRYGL